MRSIEDITAELRAAEQQKAEEIRAKLKATPVERRFKFAPSKSWRVDELLDDAYCRFYDLVGEVSNKEEALAAGHSKGELSTSGMTYAYCVTTRRLVCGTGSGTTWVRMPFGDRRPSTVKRWKQMIVALGEFLGEFPEGGDVTHIIAPWRGK